MVATLDIKEESFRLTKMFIFISKWLAEPQKQIKVNFSEWVKVSATTKNNIDHHPSSPLSGKPPCLSPSLSHRVPSKDLAELGAWVSAAAHVENLQKYFSYTQQKFYLFQVCSRKPISVENDTIYCCCSLLKYCQLLMQCFFTLAREVSLPPSSHCPCWNNPTATVYVSETKSIVRKLPLWYLSSPQ